MVLLSRVGSVLGAAVTTLLFVLPVPYAYAPIVGAAFAGVFRGGGPVHRAKAGVEMGVLLFPMSLVVALLLIGGFVPVDSGAQAYAAGMSGAGSSGAIFYAIFAYSYAVYSAVVGLLLAGTLGAVLTYGRRISQPTN